MSENTTPARGRRGRPRGVRRRSPGAGRAGRRSRRGSSSEPELAAALEHQRAGLDGDHRRRPSPCRRRSRCARASRRCSGGEERCRAGAGAGRAGAGSPARGWPPRPLAAVAIVVAFSGGPATAEVLAAATRPPAAAVQLDPEPAARSCATAVDDVRFPNYEGKFGWEAEGTRTDEIGGRDDPHGVLPPRGPPRSPTRSCPATQLAWPPGADRTEVEGDPELRVFDERGPHGRHLAAQRPDLRPLLHRRPAGASCSSSPAWKGQGAVDF